MLNVIPLKRVEVFKYLGVIIDSNISWSSHTDYLCNKVSSRIGILKPIMPCLTLPSAQTVYKTTIQPLFDYCGVVWAQVASHHYYDYRDYKIVLEQSSSQWITTPHLHWYVENSTG